jgi:hypothetical protein
MSRIFGEKFLKKKELYPGIKAWREKILMAGGAPERFKAAAKDVLRPGHIEYNLTAVLRRRTRRGQRAIKKKVKAVRL